MRRILWLLLLLAACSAKPPAGKIAIPQSYLFSDGGGQLVIGKLLPEERPVYLAHLLTERQREKFIRSEYTEEPEEEVPEEYWFRHDHITCTASSHAALEKKLGARLGVKVLIREIMRSERQLVPVLFGSQKTLLTRCRAVLKTLPDVGTNPFRIKRATRRGARVFVELAQTPDRAALTDLSGKVVWSGDPALGIPAPDPQLDPFTHRLVVERAGLRRAWTIAELVGTIERDILGQNHATAGGTYALRVIYTNSLTGKPVAGVREGLQLKLSNGTVLSAPVVSNPQGTADLRLAIPGDAPDGRGKLTVLDGREPTKEGLGVRILREFRVSLATDRTLYRPNDKVHLRLMARHFPSGLPARGVEIVIKHPRGERRVVTSENGIASTELELKNARPGMHSLRAQCGTSRFLTRFRVAAFEQPRFSIRFDPPQLRLRKGESAPMRLIARYFNGSPMVGARVDIGDQTHSTDDQGRLEFTAKKAVRVTVRDSDGRRVRRRAPVLVVAAAATADETKPAEKTPLVVSKREARVGETLRVRLSDATGPLYLDVIRNGTIIRTLSADGDEISLPLEPDLAGILELHAYRFVDSEPNGHRIRVLVRRDKRLTVEASPERAEYRPGEIAIVKVKVRDKRGEPTSAVLGYWALDEAFLEIGDFGDGHEAEFDIWRRSQRPGNRRLDYGGHHSHRLRIRHRRTSRQRKIAKRQLEGLLRERIAGIQKRFNEIYEKLPLEDYRTATTVRERLLSHVRRGELDPALLLDPWGTPLSISRTPDRPQMHWASAGPDLAWGTGDDLAYLSALEMPWQAVALFEFVRRETGVKLPFTGPYEWNFAIGLSGGAAGGRYSLRAGGGSGLRSDLDPKPAHYRREGSPTLCFVPEAVVGPDGNATLAIPLADAITRWRMRLVASDETGATGITTTSIRVSQPLSVDPWIAPHLTVGDSLDLPVSVRNDTGRSLRARIQLRASGGIEAIGPVEATIEIGPRRTGAHTFLIRAVHPGRARVRVLGAGGGESDAVERFVTVAKDRREVTETVAGPAGRWISFSSKTTRGRMRLDVYPDPVAEAVAGFEGLIREPHGCFEQTSSTLYPMVLVLDYLRRTKQSRPALEERAYNHIKTGYQKLLGYEVGQEPGGFSLWGRAPARPLLSAYGLMEFVDLARVFRVDQDLPGRIVRYLRKQQRPDGSWGDFKTTAYIAWALRSAGEKTPKALDWLRAHDAEDAYGRALAALAGAARLVEQAWSTDTTVFSSRGISARIETTALAAQALLLQENYAAAQRAIDGLLAMRDGRGRFGTTQSTVQALRALLAARSDGEPGPVQLSVLGRGGEVIGSLEVEREARMLSFGSVPEVMVRADRDLRFTLTKTTFVPWAPLPAGSGRLLMEVRYPGETLRVNKTYTIRASVVNAAAAPARQVTLLIGVPPGCDIEHAKVKGAMSVERAERAVVIYLDDLEPGERRSFEIPFSPRYRLDVKTAPSRGYEYYTPEEAAIVAPVRVRAR